MKYFIWLLILSPLFACKNNSASTSKIISQNIPSPPPLPKPVHCGGLLPLDFSEVMPKYPNGADALKTDIHKRIQLSSIRQLKGGKIIVRFVVKKDGSIGKVKIIKSIEGFEDIYNEAIINAIKSLDTKFEPGLQSEKPIDVWYTLLLEFKMNNLGNQNPLNKPYSEFLTEMKEDSLYKVNKKESLFQFINKDVPAYWVGTGWDFNGTTRIPKQGKIACGYFVTNLLTDFGFDIRRIYLAQQPSSTLIKNVCSHNSIKKYSTLNDVISYVKHRPNEHEIFIVGLDYHTGFLVKDGDELYFIHSTYLPPKGVVKEKVKESQALQTSNFFMIGSVSANDKWFQ